MDNHSIVNSMILYRIYTRKIEDLMLMKLTDKKGMDEQYMYNRTKVLTSGLLRSRHGR